jgi:hypothetical protein
MRRGLLSLALLVVAPAWADDPIPEASTCNDDFAECKENCTIDYGGSLKTRDKLGKCMKKCDSGSRDCRERFFEVHRNKLDPSAMDEKQRPRDPIEPAQPSVVSDKPPAPQKDEVSDEPVPKRTATRISDLAGDEKPEPEKKKPEPEKKAEAKAPSAPAEKKPEKKRALDEWDPDAL